MTHDEFFKQVVPIMLTVKTETASSPDQIEAEKLAELCYMYSFLESEGNPVKAFVMHAGTIDQLQVFHVTSTATPLAKFPEETTLDALKALMMERADMPLTRWQLTQSNDGTVRVQSTSTFVSTNEDMNGDELVYRVAETRRRAEQRRELVDQFNQAQL